MNFKQNQHKLSNNHVQFSNQNLLCKFEPPSRKSWIRPCFYHLFYFINMGQPIWVPIWDPYRLLAGQWLMVGSVLHHILGCEACELHFCTNWLYYKPHFIYPKLTVSHKGASVFFIVSANHSSGHLVKLYATELILVYGKDIVIFALQNLWLLHNTSFSHPKLAEISLFCTTLLYYD